MTTNVTKERLEYLAEWSIYHCLPGGVMTPKDSFLDDPDEIHAIITELLALRAASIPPAAQQETVTPTHRHRKSGTEYVLIGFGRMQVEGWGTFTFDQINEAVAKGQQFIPADNREVVIYRSATDPAEVWVRPREEFEDGRFVALSAKSQNGETE